MPSVEKILNSNIPNPSFSVIPGRAAPLNPDMSISRDNVDGAAKDQTLVSGEYVGKGENTARIYGPNQGLLVQANALRNKVKHSAAIVAQSQGGNWSEPNGGSASSTAKTNIIDHPDANAQRYKSSSLGYTLRQDSCDNYSGGTDVASVVVEKGSTDKIGFSVENKSTSDKILIEYTFSSGGKNVFLDQSNAVRSPIRVRDIAAASEGGRPVKRIAVALSENSSDSPRFEVIPDRNGNAGSATFHHAQITDRATWHTPIPTDETFREEDADNYQISAGDWYNPNEGTWVLEFKPFAFKAVFARILAGRNSDGPFLDTGNAGGPLDLAFNNLGISFANACPTEQRSKLVVSYKNLLNPKTTVGINGSVKDDSKLTRIGGSVGSFGLGTSEFHGVFYRVTYRDTYLDKDKVEILSGS